jgi:hypothetical protein
MQLVAACILLVACFLGFLFQGIEPKPSVSNKFLLLALLIFVPAIYMGACLQGISRLVFFIFLAAAQPVAELTSRAVRRRRVTVPPRIGVKGPNGKAVCITAFTALMILQSLIIAVVMKEDRWIDIIPFILVMNSYHAYFIVTRSARSEIYGNGIWFAGQLVAWDKFHSFSRTTKGGKALVELNFAGERPHPYYGSIQLTVPPKNLEAANRLLEANLTNISSPTAGA